MQKFVMMVCAAVLAGGSISARQTTAAAPSFAEPGISPDGREIAFVSAGDIWTVPAEGGEARLLVAHGAAESRPMYAPDGRRLAFVSTRTGGGDIYILDFASGALRRLTFDDGLEQLDGWSRDGQWIYFSSTSRDIAGMNDIYRVRATGGTPMAVSDDAYVNEFAGAMSPNGRTLAFSARGSSSGQWWRRGHSHLDMSELWTLALDGDGKPGRYTQLTERNGKSSWPMWSADGRTLFFMSDRDGAENLWARPATPGGSERRLTNFTGGRLLWPTMTADGRRIAFEREFGIWTMDVAGDTAGEPRQVPIVRRGAVTAPDVERLRSTSQFSDLALSPDGRKIAFVSRGEIFAAAAREGGDAVRVTTTSAIESSPVWAPDSRRLAYVSTREGEPRIYLYDFATNVERPLTAGGGDRGPAFSPDGKQLAFVRARREVRVIEVDAKDGGDTKLAEGLFGDALDTRGASWSPDGRWLAIFAVGTKGFTNVQLVPAAGGPPRPVSFVSNVFANTISWGRDGTFLLFDTRQRTEDGQLARVDLVLRTPRFREDQFRDLFTPPARPAPREPGDTPPPADPAAAPPADPKTEKPAPPKPVEPVFEDIRRRISLVDTGLDVSSHAISPDGKSAVLVAGAAGQQNLYLYPLDELATSRVARQLTTTAAGKSSPQFSPDGREIFYFEGGRINIVNVEQRTSRPVNVTAEMTVNFEEEKHEVFRQAWTLLRDNFYDPAFHGVDWNESQKIYGPRVAGAGSPDEMRRLINLMIGDLNASHLGTSSPGGGGPQIGKLGLRFDRMEYERAGRLRVTSVIPLGPAAVGGEIRAGDYLLAIDGVALGAGVNLDERLQHAINRRVMLRVSSSADGASPREVAVRPINQAGEKNLLYRAWVEANREYVLKQSGGRLGYVHMFSMGGQQLEQLYMDLDAENHARDGVVIDIRNNNGGFVNVYAIDVIARQPYLRMTVRGMPEVPARTVLGQRALEAPTALVTNQHSLSDAEDFTEGYRTLKLGPVIGEPTSGWIIYTWNTQLIDGTGFRLPRMKVVGADGVNMELNPRPVDIPVTRPVGETKTGKDSQLDRAIAELIKRISARE
ncbi:MAG TPA: S41 family peptidase [Vicinamibacterales bacterium]|nr:S41 family peptidase [Vicinamibacterales bacterium]